MLDFHHAWREKLRIHVRWLEPGVFAMVEGSPTFVAGPLSPLTLSWLNSYIGCLLAAIPFDATDLAPMKTERRHELEHNELADRLAQTMESVGPYSKHILIALIAIFVVVGGWRLYTNSVRSRDEAAWAAYFDALSFRDLDTGGQKLKISKLKEVLGKKEFAGTPAMAWTRLELADVQLDEGIDQLFTASRAEGEDNIADAKRNYERLLKEEVPKLDARNSLLVSERATIGLAKAQESLGETDEARHTYEQAEKKFPLSSYKGLASERAADLAKPEAAEFYDWFRQQEPRRATMPGGPGMPGERPSFESLLDDASPFRNPGAKSEPSAIPEVDDSFFDKKNEGGEKTESKGAESKDAGSKDADPAAKK